MNKLKILKILYVTTTALLITNISAFAKGEKVKTQEIEIAFKDKKQFKEDKNKKVSQNKPVESNSKTESESEVETAPETDDENKKISKDKNKNKSSKKFKEDKNKKVSQNKPVESNSKTESESEVETAPETDDENKKISKDKNKNKSSKKFKKDENKKVSQNKTIKSNSKTENESEAKTAPETDDEQIQILRDKKTNICGIDFMRVLTNKYNFKLDFSIYNGCIIFSITGKEKIPIKDKIAGELLFWFTIKSDKGLAHLIEHILARFDLENKEKDRKNGRISTFYSNYYNNKAIDYSNASTSRIDIENNFGEIAFSFSQELFQNPEYFKKFCNEFLGNPLFKRDGNKLLEKEVKNDYYGQRCGRALMEMYKRLKHSEQDGTIKKIGKEISQHSLKLNYEIGGTYEKMSEVTPKDLYDFYDKFIKNNTPILILYGDDYNEIKKPLSMFKENFLDKKKRCNVPEKGEDKFKDDYIKFQISPETSKETNGFEFTTGEEGNKKIEKTKQKAIISKNIYDFNLLDKFVLTCLKDDFFEKRIDLKKYGFKKIINRKGEDGFFLDIFGDDENNFKEKRIKNILKSIKKDIIENLNEKGIDFEKDIDKEILKNLKKGTKEYNYSLGSIMKDMIRSYILEKTPFSKKLFKLNKEGKLENNFKNWEEYIKKNCVNILKKLLEKKIKLIEVLEEKEGNYDAKKDYKFNDNVTYLPIEFLLRNPEKPIEEIPEIMLAEEILSDYIFIPSISDKGLTYEFFVQSCYLNLFMLKNLCDLEMKNMKNFFDKDFKKHLNELNKKLKNSSLDKLLDLKINSFKDIIKISKNNLEKAIGPNNNYINDLKKLLNKKEIYFKDFEKIDKNDKSTIQPFIEAERLLKYPKEEYEKIIKAREKARKHDLKIKEWAKNVAKKIKNNAKKYDEQTTKEYQKLLRNRIKFLEHNLKLQKDGLKKLEAIEKIFNEKDSLKKIREGAKEKINKLKIYDFDKFNKEQENKFKNKKQENKIKQET